MPPWFDWPDYLGTDAIGRLIGWWLRFCVLLPRRLVALVVRNEEGRHQWSWLRRVGKMAVSTLLTLGVWIVVTWKPVWVAAGADGDRVLTMVLIFVSAAWPISLVWIWFSKPKFNSAACRLQAGPSRYTGSSRTKAI
jgi:hypothetical protein